MHTLIQGVIKIIFLQQKAESHMVRREHEMEEEEGVQEKEEVEEGDDHPFTSQHECPLIQQKVNEYPGYSSSTFNHGSACVPHQ